MKKLLVYYSTYEITNDSKRSVPRLLASLVSYLESYIEISFFTFNDTYQDEAIKKAPVHINISKKDRVEKRISNLLNKKNKLGLNELKRKIIDHHLLKEHTQYDFVLALKLTDLKKIRSMYPNAVLLYWFHDLTIAKSGHYMMDINYAHHVITPSVTAYHRILKLAEPDSLISEWHFIGNWVSDVFKTAGQQKVNTIKEKYKISYNTKVLIFTGGDLPFKGGSIIEKAAKKLSAIKEVVVFYAGETKEPGEKIYGNTRIIKTGNLSPEELAAFYAVSQFSILPSLGYDHCPVALLEMITAGLLPVVSNLGGISEIVGKDYSFMVDTPAFVNSWEEILNKVLSLDVDVAKNITEQLQKNIETNYNADRNRQKFLDIITSYDA